MFEGKPFDPREHFDFQLPDRARSQVLTNSTLDHQFESIGRLRSSACRAFTRKDLRKTRFTDVHRLCQPLAQAALLYARRQFFCTTA
jgi:hypothetical protein